MSERKMCPLMAAGLTAGVFANPATDPHSIGIKDKASTPGKDTPPCIGEDCQLWWFCSGEFAGLNCINVDASVNKY